MPIYRLLRGSAFDPEAINAMTTAYEDACRALMLSNKLGGPVTELIAKKIIQVAQTGERDPVAMRKRALQELGLGPGR